MGMDYLRIQSSVDVQTGQQLSADDIDVDIALSNLVCSNACFAKSQAPTHVPSSSSNKKMNCIPVCMYMKRTYISNKVSTGTFARDCLVRGGRVGGVRSEIRESDMYARA